ncbi:PHD and RING finger domain-containing protein 1 [Chytriomyces hyalinus]|nr:PHD and RING finger domain-containing protein 1 [Chytriomyces hyalinus]
MEDCAVCLGPLVYTEQEQQQQQEEIAKVAAKCHHIFHLNCIFKWAEHHASCPVDRLSFDKVHIVSYDASKWISTADASSRTTRMECFQFVRTVPVQTSIHVRDDEEEEEPAEDEDVCLECNMASDAHGLLLLCDICNGGFHLGCVGLSAVPPETTWICPKCNEATLLSTQSSTLQVSGAASSSFSTVASTTLSSALASTASSSIAASIRPVSNRNQSNQPTQPNQSRPNTRRVALASIRRDIARARIARRREQARTEQALTSDTDTTFDLHSYLRAYRSLTRSGFRGGPVVLSRPILEAEAASLFVGNQVGSVHLLKQSYKRKLDQQDRIACNSTAQLPKETNSKKNDSQLASTLQVEDIWAQFTTAKRKAHRQSAKMAQKLDSTKTSNNNKFPAQTPLSRSAGTPSTAFKPLQTLPHLKSSESEPLLCRHNTDASSIKQESGSHSNALKSELLDLVKKVLDPMFKEGEITRDVYKDVAKRAVHTLIAEVEAGSVSLPVTKERAQRSIDVCMKRRE